MLKWIEKNFELVILAIFLAIMAVLSFANVIMRFCFKSPLSWSDEICCYCLALSAFFCLPCAIRHGSSIRVDTFVTLVPKNVQNILAQVCNLIMIVFLGFLLKGTVSCIQTAASIGQASPALQIPVAFLYGLMAFGIALAIVRYIQAIIMGFKGKAPVAEPEVEVEKV